MLHQQAANLMSMVKLGQNSKNKSKGLPGSSQSKGNNAQSNALKGLPIRGPLAMDPKLVLLDHSVVSRSLFNVIIGMDRDMLLSNVPYF